MSTSSVPTLKGIFNEPKPSHRRDFLRENKLSLRELQRITTGKQTQQQQKQPKLLKSKQPTGQQANKRRSLTDEGMSLNGLSHGRSVSQQRSGRGVQKNAPSTQKTDETKSMSRCPSCCGSGTVRNDVAQMSCNKEIQTEDIYDEQFLYDALQKCTTYDMKKQLAEPDSVSNYNQHDDCGELAASVANLNINGDHNKDHGGHNIHNSYGQHHYADQHDYHGNYNQDATSHAGLTARSQASYTNFPQQGQMASVRSCARGGHAPEDSHSFRSRQEPQQSNSNGMMDGAQMSQRSRNYQRTFGQSTVNGDNEVTSTRSRTSLHSLINGSGEYVGGGGGGDGGDGVQVNHNNAPPSQRSQGSQRTQHSQTQHGHEDGYAFDQRSALTHDGHHAQNMSQPLSGRSQQSVSTQNTALTKKKSVAGIHKLGSRDDIRLPRYLEREKREKEEQHAQEMLRDVNCPLGHYQLSEDERLGALAMGEKKFQELINELNRMPMTTQTLRIRTRKAEIEKELAAIEAEVRILSKPKVYVKNEEYP